MNNDVIEFGDVRVVFEWCGDRYGHTIERRMNGEWIAVLESVEGQPHDDWPPSPPLQSLHIEQRTTGPVALLVGQAGTSHWSASVEPQSDSAGFWFDVACRINHKSEQIGSRYKSIGLKAAQSIAICVQPNAALADDAAGRGWLISPLGVAESLPNTVRWRYQLTAAE